MKAGDIPNNFFAIALQRDKSEGGYLSFGGLPPVKTYGSTVAIPFAPPRDLAKGQSEYTISIDGFVFGDATVAKPASPNIEALIDSGTSILLVPATVARAYNALWDPKAQDAPPLSIILGGKEFALDTRDLKITANGKTSSAVAASKKTIFGDTFMRNVVSVFDVVASQMRFISTNPASGAENQNTDPPKLYKRANVDLQQADIVPTVIAPFEPTAQLVVKYGQTELQGRELSKADTASAPKITLSGTAAKYTIVMFDPDAPRNAGQGVKQAAFLHAIATGVTPGTDLDFAELTRAGVPYRGPGPPPLTSLHRYIFVALEEGATSPANVPATSRRSFKIEDFISASGMKLVGATYMVVQNTFGSAPTGFVKPLP